MLLCPAAAQTVRLEFHDGRVSLSARYAQSDRLSAFDGMLIQPASDAPQAAGLTQPAVTRPPIEQVLLPLGQDIREQPPAREPEATR